MKKLMLVTSFLLMFCITTPAAALTFNELPTKQSSEQWEVQVGKAILQENSTKPEEGKFQTYSLKVNNIGEDVNSVEIKMYRDDPNSKTKYSLTGCLDEKECDKNRYEEAISLAQQLNEDEPFIFQNFLIAEWATELEVEVVWTQKDNPGRPLKETFIFKD